MKALPIGPVQIQFPNRNPGPQKTERPKED